MDGLEFRVQVRLGFDSMFGTQGSGWIVSEFWVSESHAKPQDHKLRASDSGRGMDD